MPQLPAYSEGRNFFVSHPEYTHFIIIPDDLEVPPESLKILVDDMQFQNLKVISGICNIDEDRPEMYAIQPLGCNFNLPGPPSHMWYNKENRKHFAQKLPDVEGMLQVGHSGFCCEIIERELFLKVSWIGADVNHVSNFDWQFSHDCKDLGVEIWVDTNVKLWHRRNQQRQEARRVKVDSSINGFTQLLKKGETKLKTKHPDR